MNNNFNISGNKYNSLTEAIYSITDECEKILKRCNSGEFLSCVDIEAYCIFDETKNIDNIPGHGRTTCAYTSLSVHNPLDLGRMRRNIRETAITAIKQILECNLPDVTVANNLDRANTPLKITFVTQFFISTNDDEYTNEMYCYADFKNLDTLENCASEELNI